MNVASPVLGKSIASERRGSLENIPVLAPASRHDYILFLKDRNTWQNTERSAGPLAILRLFERSGHVGLAWNPEVAETTVDFAASDIV